MSASNTRRFVDGAVIVIFTCVALALVVRVGFAPTATSENVAVVFSPWTDEADTLTRSIGAGARFVRYGGAAFIAIVAPETPDYAANVRARDAWLVVDARFLLACLGAVGQ